jgi:hypothetical protein
MAPAGNGEQECGQRKHFDGCGPEFELAEHRHRDEVRTEHDRQRRQRERPLRDAIEHRPEVKVGGDRGRVRNRGDRPAQQVHPADDVCGLLAEEFAGVRHERPPTADGAGRALPVPAESGTRRKRPVPMAPPSSIICNCRGLRLFWYPTSSRLVDTHPIVSG